MSHMSLGTGQYLLEYGTGKLNFLGSNDRWSHIFKSVKTQEVIQDIASNARLIDVEGQNASIENLWILFTLHTRLDDFFGTARNVSYPLPRQMNMCRTPKPLLKKCFVPPILHPDNMFYNPAPISGVNFNLFHPPTPSLPTTFKKSYMFHTLLLL